MARAEHGEERAASVPRPGRWLVRSLREAGWAPAAVFAAHVVASRLLGLYGAYPSLDVPMHVFGGVAIAHFLWRSAALASEAGLLGSPNRTGLLAIVLGTTCAAAVGWEVAEFLSDQWLGTSAQLGLEDTLGDLLLRIAGGAAYAGVAWLRGPPRPGPQ